jgi:hypothetical protein
MSILKDNICSFCGKKKKWTSTNSVTDFYCEACLRNAKKEITVSLSEISVAKYEERQRRKIKCN